MGLLGGRLSRNDRRWRGPTAASNLTPARPLREFRSPSWTRNSTSRWFGNQTRALGNRTRGFSSRTRALDNQARALDNRTRGFSSRTRALGNQTRAFGSTTRAHGSRTRAFGSRSRGLGNRTRGVGSASARVVGAGVGRRGRSLLGMGGAEVVGARRIRAEILVVLGLSLGQSAVYAILRLYVRLTSETPLASQSTTLNPTVSPRPYVDLTYQLLGIVFMVVPVALALYLLAPRGRDALARIGLDGGRPARDVAVGLGLAGAIGIPGLGFYVAGRALGLNVQINASGLGEHWWVVPVLVLSALANSLLEEVVVVGYLMERLLDLRWGRAAVLVASALLRGAYHLYQGPGMALGNVVMGLVFGWWYLRTRRVMPLVVAHTALDVASFVGFALLPDDLLRSLGVLPA